MDGILLLDLLNLGWARIANPRYRNPKVNPKAFETEPGMFKVKPKTTVLIVITLLIIVALYVKFW
ncbi:hypothetical protein [Flavobacterium sp.]|uniref:hypothetical protein n=1 Tax=Flavobacterium sp. TaxID=239 RepID=UPI0031CF5436